MNVANFTVNAPEELKRWDTLKPSTVSTAVNLSEQQVERILAEKTLQCEESILPTEQSS